MLLAKIMEKIHLQEEKIKLTDTIKKRNFKIFNKSKSVIVVNNKKILNPLIKKIHHQ